MKTILKVVAALLILFVVSTLVTAIVIQVKQEQIVSGVSETLRKYVNGKVEIGGVGVSFWSTFPHPAVKINDLSIIDSLYQNTGKPFLKADDVYIKLNIPSVLHGTPQVTGIEIDNGSFNVFTAASGAANDYIFKGRSVEGYKNKLIDNLRLQNVTFNSVNEQKHQSISIDVFLLKTRINQENDVFVLNTSCDVFVETAVFKGNPSNFLSNKKVSADFRMIYNNKDQQLHADSIEVNLNGRNLNIGLSVDMSGNAPVVSSKINSGKILLF